MYNLQRWIKLLLLALVLISMRAYAEEEAHHEAAIEEEDVPVDTEPVEEYVEEVADEPEVVEEIIEQVESILDAVGETTESLVEQVKRQLSAALDAVRSKATACLDRCQSMSRADVKKVAAAAVGIWGVAVGVGYLTKGAPTPVKPTVVAGKKK